MADHTTRNVVVVGGAVALFLMLFRGSGWGLGGSGGPSHSGDASGTGTGWLGFHEAARTSLCVHVSDTHPKAYGIGATKDIARAAADASPVALSAVVDAVARAGAVDVRMSYSGAAITGDIDKLVDALRGIPSVRLFVPGDYHRVSTATTASSIDEARQLAAAVDAVRAADAAAKK